MIVNPTNLLYTVWEEAMEAREYSSPKLSLSFRVSRTRGQLVAVQVIWGARTWPNRNGLLTA